jgi:hypothetical protein
VQLHRPGQRLVGLGQHVGCAAHALDAAGDDEVRVARRDRPPGLHDRLAARGTQPVDRHPRDRHRQAGQQRRHPRHVAVLLAGAVGVAVVDVFDAGRVEPGVPGHQLGDGKGGEVVGTDARERAAVLAERRADRVDEVDVPELAHMSQS